MGFGGLLALILLLVLLSLQLLEPRFFLRDDNSTHFLPAYDYAYNTLVGAGEVPLLNHHQMFGGTFLASGQTGVFLFALYPVHAVLDVLGLDPANLIDVLATLHLWLAGIGMWVLLRHWGIRPALAFPLALCWSLLPFGVIAGRSWIFVTYLQAYLPINLWLLLRCLERPTPHRWIALIFVKAIYFGTGYLHYAILTSFFELCFLCVFWLRRPRREMRRQIFMIGAAYLLTGLLSAPLLIPTWNAKQLSIERASPLPLSKILTAALNVDDALKANLFLADSLGFSQLSTAVYFVGPCWWIGLFLALKRLRRSEPGKAGESGNAVLPLLSTGAFAFSMTTSLYWILGHLPIFNVLRWPFKGFPIAAFFLLLAAAISLASWAAERPNRVYLVAGLVWLNLFLELAVLAPTHWRAPMLDWRLDRPVAQLRASPFLQAIGDQGRVVLLASEKDPPDYRSPLALGFLYATLAGKYHVTGYDPLRSKINSELGYGLPYFGEMRIPDETWPSILRTLKARYLILHATSHLLPVVEATPSVRRLASAEGLVLFENASALPIVFRAEDGSPIPFRWRTNGLELDLPPDFPGGHLVIAVAGLEGYRWYLDGENQGAPEVVYQMPMLTVPPGAGHIELRYHDRGFLLGVLLALIGLLVMLVGLRRGNAWLTGPKAPLPP